MAIQQFGESLLSDIRTRRAKEEKRLRKQEEKQAILSLGVGVLGKIGNNVLQDKMSNFLMNENILKENAQFKAATKYGEFWTTEQNEVNKSGLDAQEYYYNTMRPIFEEQAKANIKFEQVGDAGQYNALINDEVRKLAQQRADTLKEAMKHVNQLGTADDYKARVSLIAKDARGTDLLDAAFKKGRNFLSGKSQAEIDAEAIERLQNSSEALAAEDMLEFQKRYKETGSLVMAYDYAKLQSKLDERQKLSKDGITAIKEEDIVDIKDDKVFTYTKVTTTNRNNGEVISVKVKDKVDSTGKPISPVTITENTDVSELEDIDLKSRITQFNFATHGKDNLIPSAYSDFVKEVQDTTGVVVSSIKSLEDYNKVSKIYNKYLQNSSYVSDATMAGYQQKLFGSYLQNGLDMQMFLYNISQNPQNKQKYLTNILNGMSTATELGTYLTTPPLKPVGIK